MNQYKAAALTLAKVFTATCLGQFITLQRSIFDVSPDAARAILSAGVSAVIVTAYNWLDVTDTRYGRGHE
jgi:hypothetical protein